MSALATGRSAAAGRVPSLYGVVLIALNRYVRHERRRSLAIAAALLVAFSVLVAHSAVGAGHMEMGTAGSMTDAHAITMCLAIAETAAVVLLATGFLRRHAPVRLRLQPRASWPPQLLFLPLTRSTPARAGPADLQVFRL